MPATPEPALGQVLPPASVAPALLAVAERFQLPGRITAIEPLGNGNVNDTYRVVTEGEGRWQFVLQRLNTHVFEEPELVMANLLVLADHVAARLEQPPEHLAGRRWEIPQAVRSQNGGDHWLREGDDFWRTITYIERSRSLDTLADAEQAREVGFALGTFHALIADLPAHRLADTLVGFHVTPGYLDALEHVLAAPVRSLCPAAEACVAFVQRRRGFVPVLERARLAGRLPLRPIHGDPKVNNVLLDLHSRAAIGLVDLDTVKPGLVHYDIGDALRSACNRLGEDAADPGAVSFDLELCSALLQGYLEPARAFLLPAEIEHLYDAIRLLPLELGIRFLTDHLAGDRYFRVREPGHNLARARVQFQLTQSIEAQEEQIRALIRQLA